MSTYKESLNSIFFPGMRGIIVVSVLAAVFGSVGHAQVGVIADSVSEFSGTQGQYNWYYGYYDGDGPAPWRNSDFEQLPHYGVSIHGYPQWDIDTSVHDTALWANGGHPDKSPAEHWVVRRWVSEVIGLVTITGRLAKLDPTWGDGITGYILVDGAVVWQQYIAYNDTVGVNYTVDVVVNIGSLVDFAIAPNDAAHADGTRFTAEITRALGLLVPNGGEMWVAGTTQNIEWESCAEANIPEVKIEYSDSNGQAWDLIDANTANDGEYEWLVPDVTSPNCLVRISDANDANVYDTSDDVFTIFECLGPVPGDLNEDCYVNFFDIAIVAQHWLHTGNPLDPASGIVACWRFDEGSGTIAHDSCNDHDGTLVGDANWVDGIYGKALDFDGSGDYVGLPSSSSLSFNTPSEAFSASFWIKPATTIPIEQTILENEDDYLIYLNEGYLSYRKTDSGNLYHNSWFSTNPEISAGNWFHVVITYDGTGAGGTKMYVNGEEKPVTNTAYHGGGSASGDDFAIGIRAFDFASEAYNGKIDEVSIYNRALTATEVQYLYQNQ